MMRAGSPLSALLAAVAHPASVPGRACGQEVPARDGGRTPATRAVHVCLFRRGFTQRAATHQHPPLAPGAPSPVESGRRSQRPAGMP